MKYEMLGKRVLLDLLIPDGYVREGDGKISKKTAGGLIMPLTEGQSFRKNKGVVLEGTSLDVTKCKVGDKVVFEDFAPVLFDQDSNDIFWVEEDQIVARIIEE